MIKPQLNNIPTILKSYDQWVLWRYEDRNGKKTKVPYTCGGKRASVTNHYDWSSFDDAVIALEYIPDSGLGFIFSEEDPFIGIDWDNITDGDIIGTEFYNEIISLETYAEFSPSNRGIHAICRGILPKCKHRGNSREIYKSGRFFTVTGNHLIGTPETINAAPAIAIELILNKIDPIEKQSIEPVEFDDQSLDVDEAEARKIVKYLANRQRFVKLVRGDWNGYKSQSEADYALCTMIAQYTNCPSMIRYIFSKTKLYRKKFDGKYGKLTINSVLSAKLIKEVLEEL